ncbi:hypothetical protein [Flagellimonas sp. C4]|uniref:hypothetical protein n=1 Tax=Flagellimonas alginolytica TaxID=3177515 RepID=UPI0035C8B3B8
MKKYILILASIILVSCLASREERIIEKLRLELESRGLEIDTTDYFNIWISPKDFKLEQVTINITDFGSLENRDSLNLRIIQEAEEIQTWFELPDWNDTLNIFSPTLSIDVRDQVFNIYKEKFTDKYFLSFSHINTKTHKMTPIGSRLLKHWKLSEKEFYEWSRQHLEHLFSRQSKLIKTDFPNKSIFQIKSSNERLPHALIFTENFQEEAAEKIGYPFHVILNPYLPVYVTNDSDLQFLKEYLGTLELKIKEQDKLPTELITYKESGIEQAVLEE